MEDVTVRLPGGRPGPGVSVCLSCAAEGRGSASAVRFAVRTGRREALAVGQVRAGRRRGVGMDGSWLALAPTGLRRLGGRCVQFLGDCCTARSTALSEGRVLAAASSDSGRRRRLAAAVY